MLSAFACIAQTGTVIGYTKISQTSGNFGPTLANQGRFGFVSSNGNAQLLSAAPFSGNGEIHLIDLDENGAAASITAIQADQFDIFDGATEAQFGFSSVKLGDVNQDGAPDYLVGAPGLTPYGALVLLTTTDSGWDADTLTIPAAYRFSGANWGENLAASGSEILASIASGEGALASFQISASLEVGIDALYNADMPGLSGLTSGDRFGQGPALADIDLDGNTDIICGATGDDTGGTDFGAVYVIFRESDASIRNIQKIAAQTGGFNGFLNTGDDFGVSIAVLGDLNQDGTPDIGVGAPGDDDGNIDIGAVWIILLNPNGTVRQRQKICKLDGNFDGDINFDDRFGTRIANIGDVDGDGVTDIAVGSVQDDDGGTNRGALFVLNLHYCALPSAQFTHENEGATVSFSVPGGPGFEFLWNFSDGHYSQAQNPTHTFENSGNYNVCLSIFSACGGNVNCQNVSVTALPLSADRATIRESRVFPNPASENMYIETPLAGAQLRLIDLTGRVVREEIVKVERHALDVSGFNTGVYLLELRLGNEKSVQRIQIL